MREAIALIVGVLVGIGGVLLPPALAYVVGLDIHIAMATSMFGFLFTGAVGTTIYARKRSVDWRMVCWLTIGVIPAALSIRPRRIQSSTAVDIEVGGRMRDRGGTLVRTART